MTTASFDSYVFWDKTNATKGKLSCSVTLSCSYASVVTVNGQAIDANLLGSSLDVSVGFFSVFLMCPFLNYGLDLSASYKIAVGSGNYQRAEAVIAKRVYKQTFMGEAYYTCGVINISNNTSGIDDVKQLLDYSFDTFSPKHKESALDKSLTGKISINSIKNVSFDTRDLYIEVNKTSAKVHMNGESITADGLKEINIKVSNSSICLTHQKEIVIKAGNGTSLKLENNCINFMDNLMITNSAINFSSYFSVNGHEFKAGKNLIAEYFTSLNDAAN
jgi:hypothetical protein